MADDRAANGPPAPLVEVSDLSVEFRLRRGVFESGGGVLRAVDNVDFTIDDHETLGLVGESGSGKSTTGRALLRLVEPCSGSVRIRGEDVLTLRPRRLRALRRATSMVFQDPYSSLDPSMRIGDTVAEPLDLHEHQSGAARRERVADALRSVGIDPKWATRYPHELSGGQRQRIAIARSLILRPSLIVTDEAVSSLDVSTQSQIVNMLMDLQQEFGIAYLFIAHDLAIVRRVSHRVAVMYLGRIVETGPAARIYEAPGHPYTSALLSATPQPDRAQRRERIILKGELPSPTDPPGGCPFHTRCPFVMDICREEEPPRVPQDGGGWVTCHLHQHGPALGGRSVLPLSPDEFGVRGSS